MSEDTSGRTGRDDRHIVLQGPGVLREVRRPLPPLPDGWARVRVDFCGVCGTDVSRFTGRRAAGYPVSLGHEWVGVVEESRSRSVSSGDVVTTDLNFRCGTCDRCRAGRSHLCRGNDAGLFTNRGFARHLDIDATYLHVCPGPPAPHLALVEPLSCVLHALGHCELGPDDRPLVVGAGGLGLCAAFALWTTGSAGGFDVVERDPRRLASIGSVVGPSGRALPEAEGRYEVVLDTSGTASGLDRACELVAPGGRLVTLSHLPDSTDGAFLLDRLTTKDVTFTISYLNGEPATMAESVRLLSTRWSPTWDRLLEVRPLGDLSQLLRERETSPANKAVIDIASSAGQ